VMQTLALAAAAALADALDDGESARAYVALTDAAAAIDAALSGEQGGPEIALHAQLLDVVEPWREICPVHLTIDEDLVDLGGEAAHEASIIVREAIANAFRHGGATHVEVTMESRGPVISLVVADDGAGPGPKNWGLGLTLIDRSTAGHWTLVREGNRTVLNAQLARDAEVAT